MHPQDLTKIKVLLAGHLPPPVGGVGTYYQSLLSSSLPDRVNLLFVQTSTHNRELSQSGRATFSNLIAAMKDCVRFFRAVASFRPRICHIGTAFGLSFIKHSMCVFIARIFGSRVLLHPHCSLSALYMEHNKVWRWYFRQVIRQTHGVVALSKEWMQLPQIVRGCKVHSLPNAIDLAPYQGLAQQRLAHSHNNGVVHVLYLGYIGQAKGSFDLLDAAQCLSSKGVGVAFDLAGSELHPGELDLMRQKIDAANMSRVVKIHPPVLSAEKLVFFRDGDIFVYPSYSEGMPMAVIEAMASGLPIVAATVGGLPDLVREGVNGMLVEPGRSDQLAAALLRISSDSRLRHTMQENSAQIAREEYDIEQHVFKLVEIYTQNLGHLLKLPAAASNISRFQSGSH